VQQWEEQFLERPTINGCFIQSYIAAKAAQWGADQELEACYQHVDWVIGGLEAKELRAARRPKPPSLKERALQALGAEASDLSAAAATTIRRALEALDD
jgi:hypothetical protein